MPKHGTMMIVSGILNCHRFFLHCYQNNLSQTLIPKLRTLREYEIALAAKAAIIPSHCPQTLTLESVVTDWPLVTGDRRCVAIKLKSIVMIFDCKVGLYSL